MAGVSLSYFWTLIFFILGVGELFFFSYFFQKGVRSLTLFKKNSYSLENFSPFSNILIFIFFVHTISYLTLKVPFYFFTPNFIFFNVYFFIFLLYFSLLSTFFNKKYFYYTSITVFLFLLTYLYTMCVDYITLLLILETITTLYYFFFYDILI